MHKPLFGKTVVVTRAEEQAAEFIALLEQAGARVVHIPTIRFVPPDSWHECDRAIASLSSFDWAVFTSRNGVDFFVKRMFEKDSDVSALGELSLAAVGPGTETALQEMGLRVELVPETFRGEGLIAAFEKIDLQGLNVLLVKPEKSRPVLQDGLTRLGARVAAVSVYKTLPASGDETPIELRELNGDKIDVLTFTSPSTVRGFVNLCGENKLSDWLRAGCKVAAIGGVTAETLAELKLPVSIQPQTSTIRDLVKEIEDYFSCKRN